MTQKTFQDNIAATIGHNHVRVCDASDATHYLCIDQKRSANGATITGGHFMKVDGTDNTIDIPVSKGLATSVAEKGALHNVNVGQMVPVFFSPSIV